MWRQIQRDSFTDVHALASFLELDDKNRSQLLTSPKFPLLLPRRIAEKMAKNSLQDPIALQFLPFISEMQSQEGFISEPVADASFRKSDKLLQKYEGRALLIACGACAMNCRFCFRQNFSYEHQRRGFENELTYLRSQTSLHEVILSGGDPLNLSDESLKQLLQELSLIDHLRVIRFHTRFPIGIPERITDNFLSLLKASSKQVVFILHINHAKELDSDILTALKKIAQLGIPLLSQTVLLKGVNDDVDALHTLFLTLISNGIIPYYLHQLDRVQGAHHFEVSPETGLALIARLKERLPGYAVPTYVQEIPGMRSKTPI